MALDFELTAKDVADTRFAFSPLWEVVAAVRVLADPAEHVVHRPWVADVRPRVARCERDVGLLSDLVTGRTIPGFVCPPPHIPVPDLDIELATLHTTPPERVRGDIEGTGVPRTERVRRLYDEPEDGLETLTAAVEEFWERALAPYWPRIRTLLEADVRYRGRHLAEGGIHRLLNELDPNVRWGADTLSVHHRYASGSRHLGGRGLLLVPSVFVPRVFSESDPPRQPTLRYPPRGVATLWEESEPVVPDGLAAVLGRSRTRLLTELETPAPTTELAIRTGLSSGAVSQHLTALRAAGLVSAHRSGRYVLYARTRPAESLLAGREA